MNKTPLKNVSAFFNPALFDCDLQSTYKAKQASSCNNWKKNMKKIKKKKGNKTIIIISYNCSQLNGFQKH